MSRQTQDKRTPCLVSFMAGLAALVVVSHGGLHAADVNAQPTSKVRMVRLGGWRVPGLNQVPLVESSEATMAGGHTVTRDLMSLPGEPLVELDLVQIVPPDTVQFSPRMCALRRLYRYSLDGAVFAYEVHLVGLANVSGVGQRVYLGMAFDVQYYDRDGDGNFETQYQEPRSIDLPEWVAARSKR
jgi:hypothetical protein